MRVMLSARVRSGADDYDAPDASIMRVAIAANAARRLSLPQPPRTRQRNTMRERESCGERRDAGSAHARDAQERVCALQQRVCCHGSSGAVASIDDMAL